MKSVIKFGSRGEDVKYLQELLLSLGYELVADGCFGARTEALVKSFQSENSLLSDGIVGAKTWDVLESISRPHNTKELSEEDFIRCAQELGVDVASIKAVQEVETGGKGGFISPSKPTILFEGHIFWDQLRKCGKNPEEYVSGNEDILYPKWTKSHYLGGVKEYYRLEKAMKIDTTSALCSASWGMFQIMGFNYIACGFKTVQEFVEAMKKSEGEQLFIFSKFIKFNGLDKYLRDLDWAGFAKKYNGPGYRENKYDEKLKKAYKKYLG
jgi:hypothetical protein